MLNRLPKYGAEALGTFILVFAGCAAAITNEVTGGSVSVTGIGLVFGLTVMAMIYTIGHISGAHMNPAVTLAFAATGRLSKREAPFYIGAQLAGAVLAAACLHFLFLESPNHLGATNPSGGWPQSFALETFLTFILMFVVMGVATDHRAEGAMAGVAIGATVCLEAILGGPISGASMNPARSFGPALISGQFSSHWIYWAGPILGAIGGAFAYQFISCHRDPSGGKSPCC